MTTRTSEGFVVLLGAVLTLGVLAPDAGAQSKCQARKYKAMGVAVKAKAVCHAKAAKAGGAANPECLAAADAKLAAKWSKAEAAGDCVATDDLTAGVAATDDCIVGAAGVITPPTSPCCDFADGSCGHGLSDEDCTGLFGGVPGPANSICNGATGTCGTVAPAGGRCCMRSDASFCTAGPTLDLGGCVPPDFLDAPSDATCAPSGACTLVAP